MPRAFAAVDEEHAYCEQPHASDDERAAGGGAWPQRWPASGSLRAATAASLLLGGAALLGCLALWAPSSSSPPGRAPAGAGTGAAAGPGASWAPRGLQRLSGSGALPEGAPMPDAESAALDSYLKQMMGIPSGDSAVDLHDGNSCLDNEEEFLNLCYKKCSLLTNGSFPTRTSAWSCCKASDASQCFVNNQDKDFGLCDGYDVAGDGSSCPHVPGRCLENEELFMGQCYAKCSILTNGTQPHRTSAISCCETAFALSCFSPGKVTVATGINVGGGKGDGSAATPSQGHAPLASLTEGVPVPR